MWVVSGGLSYDSVKHVTKNSNKYSWSNNIFNGYLCGVLCKTLLTEEIFHCLVIIINISIEE